MTPRQHCSLPSHLPDAARGGTWGQEHLPNDRHIQGRAPWPIWARYVSGRAGEGAGPRGGRNLVGAHCGAARRTPGTPRGKLWSLRPRTKPLCVGAPSSERGGTASQCKAKRRLARRKPGDPPAPGGTNEKPRWHWVGPEKRAPLGSENSTVCGQGVRDLRGSREAAQRWQFNGQARLRDGPSRRCGQSWGWPGPLRGLSQGLTRCSAWGRALWRGHGHQERARESLLGVQATRAQSAARNARANGHVTQVERWPADSKDTRSGRSGPGPRDGHRPLPPRGSGPAPPRCMHKQTWATALAPQAVSGGGAVVLSGLYTTLQTQGTALGDYELCTRNGNCSQNMAARTYA